MYKKKFYVIAFKKANKNVIYGYSYGDFEDVRRIQQMVKNCDKDEYGYDYTIEEYENEYDYYNHH